MRFTGVILIALAAFLVWDNFANDGRYTQRALDGCQQAVTDLDGTLSELASAFSGRNDPVLGL